MTAKPEFRDAAKDMQKDMLANYYGALATANEDRRPVAYLFIPGNVVELTSALGFLPVYPEINALQCGIKKVAGDLILAAEDKGYSSDVCGYVKNDIGLMLKDRQHPMGKIPKPDLLVCNYSGCNTFIKWFEALSEFYGAPLYLLDIPYVRGDKASPSDVDYVVAQLRELAEVGGKVTGVPYEEAQLSARLERARRAAGLWAGNLELATHRPPPLPSYFHSV